ncbi:MAG: hypothetical protein Q4C70_09520 [Planctomycetia bacterium]|nr:hypothetical protein [Planctomycetia bacterium]
MSNSELFNDDFWTTHSSFNSSMIPSSNGSSGSDEPQPKCVSCDMSSPYGNNACNSEKSCCSVNGAFSSDSSVNYSSGKVEEISADASISGGATPWKQVRN